MPSALSHSASADRDGLRVDERYIIQQQRARVQNGFYNAARRIYIYVRILYSPALNSTR